MYSRCGFTPLLFRSRVSREREWVTKNIPSLAIPLNFAPSGPVQLNIEHKFNQQEWREAGMLYGDIHYGLSILPTISSIPARAHVNPQTEAFCLMLGIPNRINVDGAMDDSTREPAAAGNPDEIAIDDTSDGEECEDAVRSKRALSNEIKLESVDDVVTGSTHVDTSEQ